MVYCIKVFLSIIQSCLTNDLNCKKQKVYSSLFKNVEIPELVVGWLDGKPTPTNRPLFSIKGKGQAGAPHSVLEVDLVTSLSSHFLL